MANNSQFMGMQPRTTGQVVPPPSPLPPMPMQFHPGAAPPLPQPFVPQQFQQYPPVAPLPPQQQLQRPGLVGPPSQNLDFQPIRPIMSAQAQAQAQPQPQPQPQPQISNSYMQPYATNIPSFTGGGQSWFPSGNQNVQAVRPPQQSIEQGVVGQTWFSTGNSNINSVTSLEPNAAARNQNLQSVSPSRQSEERNCGGNNPEKTAKPEPVEKTSTYWREHTSRDGKKFYYNKRTRMSSWEKPLELMTPNERADASTNWQEVITPEGRKFYYNKVEKISKWRIPDEVKLARERANPSSTEGRPTAKDVDISITGNKSSPVQQMARSPIPVASVVKPENVETSESPRKQGEAVNVTSDATDLHSPLDSTTPVHIVTTDAVATPAKTPDTAVPHKTAPPSANAAHSTEQEVNESAEILDSGGANALEVKKVECGPLVYESKEEAKSSFMALLEMANVGSSWSWDQAMRVIINDKKYASLRTLEEKKQAFNEFVEHKKRQEAEENRAKRKKAQEDFKKMLEESKDLTSSTRWSKVLSLFENDERFQAVERVKDREDLFADYMEEFKKKERTKALEEHKRNILEYLEFLKSCDFIKASSQWRKVQNRLEADERCSRLEKIERLELFQEYVRDLEKEEEEQIKLRMEEQRKVERKNRDEFRKLMEEHVANGIITSKTIWRDYCIKVKDAPAYLAVYSNTSGSTAKDLFDDVVEDLDIQYAEDKERIEDAVKSEKISLSTSWTIEDFKTALAKEINSKPIKDINLKLVFDELLEKAKEKEEKEAKKRKRLTDDVYEFLYNSKDVSASSKWEDCKPHVEEKFIGEESFFRDIFNKLIAELKEKEKEKERKRKDAKAKKEKERNDREKKEKERKNRDRRDRGRRESRDKEKHKKEGTDSGTGSQGDESRRSRDRGRKHRKRRRSSIDTGSLTNEDDRSKPHRHSVDSKKSKKVESHSLTSEADTGSRRKRHRRDGRDGSVKDDDSKE